MVMTDLRCTHRTCPNKPMYRMIGACGNCGTKDVLMLFTAEHDAIGPHKCPTCGCCQLRTQRLATEDELPVDFEPPPRQGLDVLADRAPNGLTVIDADIADDRVTITYRLQDGWTWNDLRLPDGFEFGLQRASELAAEPRAERTRSE